VRPENLLNTHKTRSARQKVECRKGESNLKIKHACACIVMASGMLLLADGAGQAQLGTGSGSGGAVGQGDPDITRPGTGEDAPQRGAGSPDRSGGTMEQGQDSSGGMRPEGAIIMQPKPGEKGAPGSGRPPDRSTSNPGKGSAGGSSSDMGSGSGRSGSSGGTGGGGASR
jgi:hypothetical protein